jgi:hypothetical protein
MPPKGNVEIIHLQKSFDYLFEQGPKRVPRFATQITSPKAVAKAGTDFELRAAA